MTRPNDIMYLSYYPEDDGGDEYRMGVESGTFGNNWCLSSHVYPCKLLDAMMSIDVDDGGYDVFSSVKVTPWT